MRRKARILLAKVGLDTHDIGIRFVAKQLRDRGMEIIYLGQYQTPESIVTAAIQEAADIIGLSFTGGSHLAQSAEVLNLIKQKGAGDITVIVGGVIPHTDISALKEMGVKEVFAHTRMSRIVTSVEKIVNEKKGER